MSTKTWVLFYTYGLSNIDNLKIFQKSYTPESPLLPFNSSNSKFKIWQYREKYRGNDDKSKDFYGLQKQWDFFISFWYKELFITNKGLFELKYSTSMSGIGIFVLDSNNYFKVINSLWGFLEYLKKKKEIKKLVNYHSLITYKTLNEDCKYYSKKDTTLALLVGPISLLNGSIHSPHNFSLFNTIDGSNKNTTIWQYNIENTETLLKALHFRTQEELDNFESNNYTNIIEKVHRCDISTLQKLNFKKDIHGKEIYPYQVLMKYGQWNTSLYEDMK